MENAEGHQAASAEARTIVGYQTPRRLRDVLVMCYRWILTMEYEMVSRKRSDRFVCMRRRSRDNMMISWQMRKPARILNMTMLSKIELA